MTEQDNLHTRVALLEQTSKTVETRLTNIDKNIEKINEKLDDKYVTRDDFYFWRNVLVTMVSSALLMSFGLLLEILFKTHLA